MDSLRVFEGIHGFVFFKLGVHVASVRGTPSHVIVCFLFFLLNSNSSKLPRNVIAVAKNKSQKNPDSLLFRMFVLR